MSSKLRHNLNANLISNISLALIGLTSMPILFREFGVDRYAAVVLYFLVLQWSSVFDFGLAPAFGRFVAREVRSLDGKGRISFLLKLYENIVSIFFITIVIAAMALQFVSDLSAFFGGGASLVIVVLGLALRLYSGLYRQGLMAAEEQVVVGVIGVSGSVIRFGLSSLIALLSTLSLFDFFTICLAGSVVELSLFRYFHRRRVTNAPNKSSDTTLVVGKQEVRDNIQLGLSIASVGILWLLVLQADKFLILSNLEPVDRGVYLLIAQVGGTFLMFGASLQASIQPVFARAVLERGVSFSASLYLRACTINTILGVLIGFWVWVFGEQFYSMLFGLSDVESIHVTTTTYIIACAFINNMSFLYSFQLAEGKLRLHLLGSLLYLVVLTISLWWFSGHFHYSVIPLLYAALNLLYLMSWGSIIHRSLSVASLVYIRKTALVPLFALVVSIIVFELLSNLNVFPMVLVLFAFLGMSVLLLYKLFVSLVEF